jgi:SRSO17 transposase
LMLLAFKNCWTIAEATDQSDPQPHQRLLNTMRWDEEKIGRARRSCIVEEFGCPGGLLILDETGFLKSGDHSVGVQRQYSGTAGKTENCQIAVFAAYAGRKGRTLYDNRLYLPKKWAGDEKRRRKAGVPEDVEFQTKPQLAAQMVQQALRDGLEFGWVTADAVYGSNFDFRQMLIDASVQFVMAVNCDTMVYKERPVTLVSSPGRGSGRRERRRIKGEKKRVDELSKEFSESQYKHLVVGNGSKGPRAYDWAARRVTVYRDGQGSQDLWLLVRRSKSDPSQKAYYLANAPATTPLIALAAAASGRWHIEECFREAKGEVGLDDYQVRKWRSWHRHMQLAMLGHLFLTELRRDYGEDALLGPLSVAETRRLLQILMPPPEVAPRFQIKWSIWRRRHNQKARESHYKRRLARGSIPK